MEFHEIESAESGGILVLLTAGKFKVLPFDFIRQTGDFVVSEGQIHPFSETLEDANHHRGGSTETGTGGRVVVGRDGESARNGTEIPDDTRIDAPDQVRSTLQRIPERATQMRAGIIGIDPDPLPFLRFDGAVGGEVDGCIEDQAAVQVTVGRDIAPSTGEAEPQGCFAADDHCARRDIFSRTASIRAAASA